MWLTSFLMITHFLSSIDVAVNEMPTDLSKNLLQELPDPMVDLPNMERLQINENRLIKSPRAALSRMLNLTVLDASSNVRLPNDIFDAVRHLRQMKELHLSNTTIAEIQKFALSEMPNLHKLDLSENNLVSFADPGVQLPHLSDLYLQNNQLREMPIAALSRMPQLRKLNLQSNRIETVPRFNAIILEHLEELWLGSNKLREIPIAALSGMPNLTTWDMEYNEISSFPSFDKNAFQRVEKIHLRGNNNLTSVPFESLRGLKKLTSLRLPNTKIPDYAFKGMNIRFLSVEGSSNTGTSLIEKHAFSGIPRLELLELLRVDLYGFPDLNGSANIEDLILNYCGISNLPDDLCETLPSLEHLEIISNKITDIQVLSSCKNLNYLQANHNRIKALPNFSKCKDFKILVIDHNKIQSLNGSFEGLEDVMDISAKFNQIQTIAENDLKGLIRLETILLDGNEIHFIHPKAFLDMENLKFLSLRHSKFPELPTQGLQSLEEIFVTGNSKLIKFPSPKHFPSVKKLELYYPYHCCAFLREREKNQDANNSELPDMEESWTWLTGDDTHHDSSEHSGEVNGDKNDDKITCTPEPGPFYPCDDLMGEWLLRCGVWFVFVLAVCGNSTVIIVILASHTKLDVSRFLISNLAFADLFMGVYLGFLAVVDISTLGNFKNHGVEWQLSAGCRTAGFLAVLSSELSVFTLTVITLERYIAIKNAIRVNRKLQLRTAIIVMIIGWFFAVTTATLPLLKVSDYGKFSVCLPFEVGNAKSLIFLSFLLCFNAACFIIILLCYILMYCSIRGSNAWNASDFRVAKRMALLVFTDFACWAPIVFLSLTATYGSSLISLPQAKFFTVFVFPLNSCANPFLYAIFSSHFKKDLVVMCRKMEDKYPFLKITRPRISFSRRSSYSGAVSENPNLILRTRRRLSVPLFTKAFTNSITTNGRVSESSNYNRIQSDTHPVEVDSNQQLLTERITSL